MGFRVQIPNESSSVEQIMPRVDAAVLAVLPEQIALFRKRMVSIHNIPIIWWCDEHTFPNNECKLDVDIDGMLSPNMNASDIHCSLLLAFNRHIQRRDWILEREQLLSKLEERKWIEQAKRILSEIKHISEAEAYDFLRKQAMNDRKRIVDVATSIVKVYQLLREQNKGGKSL
jgi:response regulator NasT